MAALIPFRPALRLVRGAALLCLVLACVPTAASSTLERVRDIGRIRVGVDVPYGKMEFYDDKGRLAGVDIEVARAVAEDLQVRPEFVTMPFAELFDALKNDRIDVVVSAVTITEERQKSMRFSVPYFDAALQVAVRRQDTHIQQLADLRGKRVGVLTGTVGESFARKSERVDNERIVQFSNNDARIAALEAGEVDAIIMHFSLRDHPTLRTLAAPISQSYYGIAARLDDEALIERVDRVLRGLKRSGRLAGIRKKYLN
jgi:polar amino acid transport system substrate-binding protein